MFYYGSISLFCCWHSRLAKTNFTDSLGRKQGYWKKYSKDTLKYEGQFKDDIPVGEFKYYFFDGKVKAHTTYSDNGKVAKTIHVSSRWQKERRRNLCR